MSAARVVVQKVARREKTIFMENLIKDEEANLRGVVHQTDLVCRCPYSLNGVLSVSTKLKPQAQLQFVQKVWWRSVCGATQLSN